MRIKKAMPVLILAILLVMSVVWKLFQGEEDFKEEHSDEQKTVTLLACYEIKEQQDMLVQLADEYSDLREGVRVQVKFIDREDLKKEICLGVDEGKQPDLVICSGMEMAGLMGMGVLEDVEPGLAEEVRKRLLYPELMQTVSSGRNYYSLPFSMDPYVMFSNTKYAGKTGRKQPESWEDLLEICGSINESRISGLGFGVKHTSAAAELFCSVIYTYNSDFYNLSEEHGMKALMFFDTLKKRGDISKNVISCTGKDMAGEFAREKVAFLIAPVSTRVWLEQNGSAPEYRIDPIPGEAKKGLVLGGDNLGFCRGADEEAVGFGTYLYTEPVRKRLVAGLGTLPLLSGEEEPEEDALGQLSRKFMENGIRLEAYYSWFEISDVLSGYFYDLLVKKNVDLPSMAASFQDEMRVAIMSYFR